MAELLPFGPVMLHPTDILVSYTRGLVLSLAVVSNAIMRVHVQALFMDTFFSSLGAYLPRNRIVRAYSNSMSNFLR